MALVSLSPVVQRRLPVLTLELAAEMELVGKTGLFRNFGYHQIGGEQQLGAFIQPQPFEIIYRGSGNMRTKVAMEPG